MVSPKMKTMLCAALALAVGLALRLWFVAHAARIDGDTLIYGNIAQNWLQHGVYGYAKTEQGIAPTLIRLPGYPLFLAACFAIFGADHYTAVMHLQCIIDLITCLIAAALTRPLFGPRAAMAALWLGALCPFTSAYTSAPLTETLTLTTIALAFYSLYRWHNSGLGYNRWLWITALAMAYSILLRPEQGLLAAAIIPVMGWMALRSPGTSIGASAVPQKPIASTGNVSNRNTQTRRFTSVLLAALCVVLPLAPWAIRNWRTFHVIQPLAPRYATDPGETVPLGFQRWYRTWAIDYASTEEVYWNYDSAEIQIGDIPNRAFDSSPNSLNEDDEYTRTAALLNEYNQTSNDTPQFDARFAALARERIHANPIRYYIALPVARLLNMLLRPRAEMLPVSLDWWHFRKDPSTAIFATAYATLNLAYFVLGGVGLWLWHKRGLGQNAPLAWSMLAFVTLRCALLLTLDNSEPRYTLEFFPLLFVWGAILFTRQSGRTIFRPAE